MKKTEHTKERTVWLTFDDGPHPRHTEQVLTTLDCFGIRALFFLIGENVRKHGAIVRETVAAGHRVGNHTWRHPHLTELPTAEVEREIRSAEDALGDLLGTGKLFRPPFGDRNRRVNRVIRKCGYRSILWNVSTSDWSADYQPTAWVDEGVAGVRKRGDSVVLMHDVQRTTAKHLPTFVERLAEIDGLRFGSPMDL